MKERMRSNLVWGITIVAFATTCILVGLGVNFLIDRENAIEDDRQSTIIIPNQRSPGYEYSISNVNLNLSFTLESSVEADGEVQTSESVLINIVYRCELYSISYLLNDDGRYDLKIEIEGFYINMSMTTSIGTSGGTLVINDFHYEGVVDDCTDESIREALLEVADLEQWTTEG